MKYGIVIILLVIAFYAESSMGRTDIVPGVVDSKVQASETLVQTTGRERTVVVRYDGQTSSIDTSVEYWKKLKKGDKVKVAVKRGRFTGHAWSTSLVE